MPARPAGRTSRSWPRRLIEALDPNRQIDRARELNDLDPETMPAPEQVEAARDELLAAAAKPLVGSPDLRNLLIAIQERSEQAIDADLARMS